MNDVQSFTTRQGNVQETNSGGNVQSAGTFAFRKRWCQIDWRSLASVDIERVVREMDFQTLQQNVFNVAFCNIDAEEFRSLDPNFVKLFKLGQLIIEYLMHSQQYLQEQMSSQQQQIQHVTEELQLSRNEVKARVEEVKKVKRENRKRKKVIEAYQEMMNAGATGLHTCAVCHKEFVSAEFMRSHMQRRHPDHLSTQNKLSVEQAAQGHMTVELQKSLLEQMNNRLRETEEHIRQEIANKVSIREQRVLEENTHEMEQWKKRETEQLEQEVKRSVEPLMVEINKIQQEKATMEQELKKQEALIMALQAQRQVGQAQAPPVDAVEHRSSNQTRKRSKREEEDDKTGEIKQLLETQMNIMQQQLKKQEKQWKKRMQEVSVTHQQQLAESSQKISSLEESLRHTEQPSLDPTILNTIQELQQRVHKQEEQISKQQQQRNALYQQQQRSASASPVSQPTTPVKASSTAMYQHRDSESDSEAAADNLLTVSSLTATLPAATASKQHAIQFVQPGQENDSDEEDGATTAGEDEVDTAAEHAPFEQRPMIKTRFAHNPKMMANMQHETAVILEQAFAQRGISKDTTGLSDTALEEKLRNLALERQKRIQSHVEFVEHRERIVKELEQMVGVLYKPANQRVTAMTTRNDKLGGQGPSSPTLSATSGSLPNTPTKKHSKPPLISKAPVVTSTPQPITHSVVTTVKAQPTPATKIDDDSSSLTESSTSIPEGAPPSTAPPPQTSSIAPPSPIKVAQVTSEQSDSPWDSDSEGSDSVIHHTGTASKLKQIDAGHQASTVTAVKPFDISSDSEETFSLTEISEIPTGEKAKHATGSKAAAAVAGAGSKGTASSQSALTTVTAIDYDDMSDLDSDLEITQLT